MAKKLHGFEFWRSIGSPSRIVAPMVDQSELSFRHLCRQYGADLAYSPMLHGKSVAEQAAFLERFFTTNPADRPLFVQFCGHDPDLLLAAAKRVERYCDAVDLNLGCPQGIARRGRYGAFLLEETDVCVAIVRKLHEHLSVPVTVKIRKLRTWEDTIRTVLALQEAGASIITVHGRLKENIKERINTCDWDVIRRIKAHPDVRVPIFANGGIGCYEDVQACLAYTGADGVMSSEALLENPGLFSDGYRTLPGTSVRVTDRRSDAVDFAFEYLDIAEHYDEDPGAIRGHLMKMLFAPLKMHTALRNRLLSSHTIPEWRGAVGEVARMFGHRRAAAADDAALAVVKASCFLKPAQYAALVGGAAASVCTSAASAAAAAVPGADGAAGAGAAAVGSSSAAGAGAGASSAAPAAATPAGVACPAGVAGPAAPEGLEWLRCDILRPRAGGHSSALQQRKEKNNRKNAERKDRKLAAKQAKLARKQGGAAGAGAGAGDCGDEEEEEEEEVDSTAQASSGSAPAAAGGDCCGSSFAAYSAAAHEGEGAAAAPATDASQPPAKRRRVGSDGDGADGVASSASASADGGAMEGAGAVPVPPTAAGHPEAAGAAAGTAAGASTAGASKGRDDPAAVAAAAAAASEATHLLATTAWASFTGRRAVDADWEEWRVTRTDGPSCGYSKPDFLVDPLQPGLWYMRHQSGSASATAGRYAGRCGRKDGPQGFLSLIERPATTDVSTAAGAAGAAESATEASCAAAAAAVSGTA